MDRIKLASICNSYTEHLVHLISGDQNFSIDEQGEFEGFRIMKCLPREDGEAMSVFLAACQTMENKFLSSRGTCSPEAVYNALMRTLEAYKEQGEDGSEDRKPV